MHFVMCCLLLPPSDPTALQPHVEGFQTWACAVTIVVSCQANVSDIVVARGLQRQSADSRSALDAICGFPHNPSRKMQADMTISEEPKQENTVSTTK